MIAIWMWTDFVAKETVVPGAILIPLTPDHVSCSMLSADCGRLGDLRSRAEKCRERRQNDRNPDGSSDQARFSRHGDV